jgi:outer membrane receptor for ferric coprogen and ferric-rhodotorulic acid
MSGGNVTVGVRARRGAVCSALLMATTTLAGVIAPAPAMAQAAVSATRQYDIPAQSLREALLIFSQQSGLQVTAQGPLVERRTSSAVSGRMTPAEALSRLLTGTGLTFRFNGNDAVFLEPAPQSADGAIQLGPVRVEGEGQSGGGYNGLTNGTARTENTGSYTTDGPVAAATGLALTLRETPQSVTVITRQRMDDQALNSFDKVLEQVPGLYFWSSASGVGSGGEVRARGYPINSLQVDGVTIPSSLWGDYNTAAVDTAIYDSITVVRGATGLLTGVGDPSGSISLTRKRPTDTFQASVAQSIGRWDQLRSVADVGGPLNARGSVRGRLVAAYDEGESWIDRYQGDKVVAYGVLDADLGDKTTLNLALEYTQQNGTSAGVWTNTSVAFIDGSPTPSSRNINLMADWTDHHNERTIVSAALEHRFTQDWQARLAYIHSNSETAGKFGWAGVSETNLDGTNTILLTNYRSNVRADVFDARLNGRFTLWDRQHDVVIGLNASDLSNSVPLNYFDYVDGVQISDWDGSGYPEPDWSTLPSYPEKATTKQSGAYIATRLRPTDRLSILAGLRWSNWQIRRYDLTTGAMTDDRKESGVLTPYLGAGYDLTDWLTAYASYTTIFNPQSSKDVNGRTLAPEKGKSWELGFKGEWLDGRLNASAAVFWSGKDNLAVADGDNLTPQGDQAYIAADDTKAHGFDMEVSGQLAEGWQVQASYTRTLLKDSSGARLSTQVQPEHQVKLFTTWTPPSLSRLTVGGGVLWQSKIYGTLSVDPGSSGEFIDKVYTQNSYAVVNLNANYAFTDRLKLALQLNNVFDKTYRVHGVFRYYGAPRNLYATLKYQF